MDKFVALFSGQGSQYLGMAKTLYDNSDLVKQIYECGSDITGSDLAKISFEGAEDELNKTINSQPAIFAHSVAAYTVAKELVGVPDAVAGHSLGEFAALYVAGAYSLEDGFKIIALRARAMQNTAENAKGIMYAILGADYATVETACKENGGFVYPVNLNMESQTVISGEEAATEQVANVLVETGRRVKAVRLGVSSAFHTTTMKPAAQELSAALSDVEFSATVVPFFSNLTGGLLEIGDYPEYFASHMQSPVRFVEQCAAIAAFGITDGIEFGPKKTVATFLKKNQKEISVKNVDEYSDLDELK